MSRRMPSVALAPGPFALLSLAWLSALVLAADEPKPRLVIKHPDFVLAVALAPDGKTVASTCGNTVTLWEIASGKELLRIEVPKGGKDYGLAFSPDGKSLASCSSVDGTVRVWEVPSGKEVLTIKTPEKNPLCLAWSPDGALFAVGGDGLTLWDAKTGKEVGTLKGHGDLVWSVTFSPDSKRLASGSWDKTARIWEVASGKELVKITGKQRVRSVAFGPEGKTLVTGSEDGNFEAPGEVKLWDAASGKELRAFKGLRWGAHAVAVSPDGKLVAAGTDDVVKLWDTDSGELRATLRNSNTRVNVVHCVAFSTDGKTLVTGDTNRGDPNTVKVWDVPGAR